MAFVRFLCGLDHVINQSERMVETFLLPGDIYFKFTYIGSKTNNRKVQAFKFLTTCFELWINKVGNHCIFHIVAATSVIVVNFSSSEHNEILESGL